MASACDIVYDTSSSSCKLKPPVSTELMASKLVIGGGRLGFILSTASIDHVIMPHFPIGPPAVIRRSTRLGWAPFRQLIELQH